VEATPLAGLIKWLDMSGSSSERQLYPHSFRLFAFPTGFSAPVFQGFKPHECLMATPVAKHLFFDTQLK
jgi:hypothetical protein